MSGRRRVLLAVARVRERLAFIHQPGFGLQHGGACFIGLEAFREDGVVAQTATFAG